MIVPPAHWRRLRALVVLICLAAALAMPAVSSARPIDSGPQPQAVPSASPSVEFRTVVRDGESSLATVLAAAALALALMSTAYVTVRLSPRRIVR